MPYEEVLVGKQFWGRLLLVDELLELEHLNIEFAVLAGVEACAELVA